MAIAPKSKASEENGMIVEAKKLPKNNPQRPQFSNSKSFYSFTRFS